MHRNVSGVCRVFLSMFTAVLAGCEPQPVVRPSSPGGIITFGPNITETVYALGQGDRIIGVTSYCDYPPEAAKKEKVGGYLDPDLEKITLLAPELIILPGEHEKVADLAKQNGIPVLHAHMDSLTTIHDSIVRIGEALDCPDRASELWRRIQAELDAVRSAVEGFPKPKVLIINTRSGHDLNNLFTVGHASFLSELLEIAGGTNIFQDEETAYFEASKESVVIRAPEVIIEFHAGENLALEEQQRYLNDWQALPSLPAVQNGRVHLFMDSYGLRPGPRVALIAAKLAKLLHPEADLTAP